MGRSGKALSTHVTTDTHTTHFRTHQMMPDKCNKTCKAACAATGAGKCVVFDGVVTVKAEDTFQWLSR